MSNSEENYNEEEALAIAMALSIASSSGNEIPQQSLAALSQTEQDAEDYAAAEKILEEADAQERPEIHLQKEGGEEWEEEMVPVPVNEELLSQLIDMGISDVRSRKALVHGGTVEGALAWLGEHQEDPDIDQPYMVRKKDTLPKPQLTEEEKKAQLEAIKDKIKQRREERVRQEKAEEIRREKERRERGQKLDVTIEERQQMQRKRELDKAKREKEEEAKERARLRAEIARDKEIRRLNKGIIPSVLGVEGYNPSAVQYDKPSVSTATSAAPQAKVSLSATPATVAVPPQATAPAKPASVKSGVASPALPTSTPEERVDQAIATIARYRTAGDGGQALKLLLTFVKNIVEHPDDPKFRSINPESGAFKSKLAALVGPLILLKAVGFEKDDNDGKLKYGNAANSAILLYAHRKLIDADALYTQQNPL